MSTGPPEKLNSRLLTDSPDVVGGGATSGVPRTVTVRQSAPRPALAKWLSVRRPTPQRGMPAAPPMA